MLMQFWQPNQIVSSSMNKDEGKAKELTLSGSLEVVNFAIQSIQYYGYFELRTLVIFLASCY